MPSGKDTERPQLKRGGRRFTRNTRDLLYLAERLTAKGVKFVSLTEHIDTTTPMGKFMLTIFGTVAELERYYISRRQAEGIAAAKAWGVKLAAISKSPLKILPCFAPLSLVHSVTKGRGLCSFGVSTHFP